MRKFKNVFLKFGLSISAVFLFSFMPHAHLYPEIVDWETHFKGVPNYQSDYAASTSTIWQYGYTSTIKGGNLNIDFKFLAGVDPKKSWVKKERIKNSKTSKDLLNHEQGHVYINFLLLKNGELILKNQNYTISNYKGLIQKIATQIGKYYSEMQDKYDSETKHGTDLAAQSKWDQFFQSELNKFEP
jgi:hypothetical protein